MSQAPQQEKNAYQESEGQNPQLFDTADIETAVALLQEGVPAGGGQVSSSIPNSSSPGTVTGAFDCTTIPSPSLVGQPDQTGETSRQAFNEPQQPQSLGPSSPTVPYAPTNPPQWTSTGMESTPFGLTSQGGMNSANPSSLSYMSDFTSSMDLGPSSPSIVWGQPDTSTPMSWTPQETSQMAPDPSGAMAMPYSLSLGETGNTNVNKQLTQSPSEVAPIFPQQMPLPAFTVGLAPAALTTSPVSSHGASSIGSMSTTHSAKGSRHGHTAGHGLIKGSATSPSSSRLRSAAQATRSPIHKPGDTEHDRVARASHNLVEKHYRKRLNVEFEKLLSVLPSAKQEDRKVSKGEVLELARQHIKELEQECSTLKAENSDLRLRMETLRATYQGAADVWAEGGEMVDLDFMDDEKKS